jgi:hypothetical protein
MNRGQTTGAILIAGAIIDLLLFFYGLARRSYLALALPVTMAMFAITALTFWVGWTMMTLEEEEDDDGHSGESVQPVQPPLPTE